MSCEIRVSDVSLDLLKTDFEMQVRDWGADVGSSDLIGGYRLNFSVPITLGQADVGTAILHQGRGTTTGGGAPCSGDLHWLCLALLRFADSGEARGGWLV